MSDERRFDDDIGARLEQLERQFTLIGERLARIESRVGVADVEVTSPGVTEMPPIEQAVTATEELPAYALPPLETPLITRFGPEQPFKTMTDLEQAELAAQQPSASIPTERLPRASYSVSDLEERFTGRLLAWIGGLALIVGAIFFLSLAFSRGWIGPTARVIIGLFVGAGLVAAGGWAFERRDRLFGHVLTPVGLGILSLSFFAGTELYDLVPTEVGLAGALVSAVAAAVIAIRANSQLVAAYGLVTALSAPIVLGASPSATTIAFLSIALVGTTIVALYRTWSWLPALAFLLAAPQVIDFVTGDVSIAAGLTALGAFWLLNAVAAGGEEFRVRRNRLSITSTTLLVVNAAFAVGWGFYLLQGDAEWGRGLFLVVLAAAHLVLGGYFLLSRGDHHPFGMLAVGTGIAAASMALPIQLGGPVVPIGWAAEAAALAWVYASRKHGYSGLMSLALGTLAIAHLVLFEYPLNQLDADLASRQPFLNANGGTLAFILAALAVSILFVRRWPIVIPAAALGSALVVYALPYETSGLLLIGAWSALYVILYAVDQRVLEPRTEPVRPGQNIVLFEALHSVLTVGLIALIAAFFKMLAIQIATIEPDAVAPATPFWDRSTAAAALLVAALVVAGFLAKRPQSRRRTTTFAFGIVAFLMVVELVDSAKVVVAWSLLAATALGLVRFDPAGIKRYGIISGVLLGLGTSFVLTDVALPTRLAVSASSTIDHPFFWSGATASIGSIVLVLILAGFVFRRYRVEPVIWLLAAIGVVYLLSVGVVDDFQRRLGGATTLEELQKQAQVALSILWAVLGGAAVVVGLWRSAALARGAGLALLGIVTAKVFVYDLSSLDAAYRVLSFIGLGVLLLISAYLYQHIGPSGRTPAAT